MSTLRNRVQLIGHLGADPEMKVLATGAKVARLRIATNENYKTSLGEWKELTQWHTVEAWDNLAERTASQMHKGSYVMIEGKLAQRDYVDANGQKRHTTEVRAWSILSLDRKGAGVENLPASTLVGQAEEEADLPF